MPGTELLYDYGWLEYPWQRGPASEPVAEEKQKADGEPHAEIEALPAEKKAQKLRKEKPTQDEAEPKIETAKKTVAEEKQKAGSEQRAETGSTG